MTGDELEKIVTEYMDSFTTMNLASSHEDRPWSAAVYYARQRLDLIFFSSPRSRHSSDFEANPRAAASIHGDYRNWKEIKGLQMSGEARRIEGAGALARAVALYLKRYPFVKEFLSDPVSISSQVASKMSRVALYIFRPESILYLDNSEGFGNRWKLTVREGRAIGDPEKA